MGTATASGTGAHHCLSAHEVVLLLETHAERGLRADEAERRLERFGPNLLPEAATTGPLVRFARQFHHPLVYVLLGAAAVTLAIGERVDAGVILGVVLVNAVIGYVQESRAEAELDALRAMVRTTARVRRDGEVHAVPSEDLVPGDVVLLEAGDRVPADLRLVAGAELAVDESALTGESLPVVKDEVVLDEATPVADRRNMVYSGTLVTAGTAVGVAVATGAETELGEIQRLVGGAESLATPLTRKLAWFSKLLTGIILGLAAVTFAIGVARGEAAADMLTAAVALAVGAIPEGLPAAVTITLAIGVHRMARRRAVIRRMPAVETLGSTTVICSDKTGTITRNQMTVREVWTREHAYQVTGVGYASDGAVLDAAGAPADPLGDAALRWTLVVGAACNDARLERDGERRDAADGDSDSAWRVVGDPTEGALLVAAAKAGLAPGEPGEPGERIATLPFSSERAYMATCHPDPAGSLVLVKGALERVLPLCHGVMNADAGTALVDAAALDGAAHALAGDGLRVLAMAVGHLPAGTALDEAALEGRLVLTGMQGMLDPPRPAAVDAVGSCRAAGISVKLVTGDHAATAAAVARQVGILDDDDDPGRVLTGAALAAMDPAEIADAVDRAAVFARVSPEQKLRLVEGLQARGQVVAMTGDGVNDAPALQQADIGVAMGRAGTEVAKEAADMVLTDDEFATIEAAVEEGRGVFDNLTKFIVWTLPTNMAEGLVILVAIALGAVLPILPVQILWINMTTAVLLGLMLAFEPREPGIMTRPPRDPATPLLTRPLVVRILLVSALLVGGSAWLFTWEQNRGASLPEARTAAMNVFVAVEAAYLFSCRSLTRSFWRIGPLTNRWVVGGVAVQAVAQAAITYLPAMHAVFGTAAIGADTWVLIGLVAAVASAAVAVHKRLGTLR